MGKDKMDLAVNVNSNEKLTIEFINGLSENERAELIDGKVYYMAPPLRYHQKIVVKLVYEPIL